MHEQLREPIGRVINLLVECKYPELEALTNGVRLKASDMDRAISEYGRKLVPPPQDAFKLMDVVEIKDAPNPRWLVAMPLWTQEEGRADLTVEITLIRCNKGFQVELDDIHVL